jgi:hypothetical protein
MGFWFYYLLSCLQYNIVIFGLYDPKHTLNQSINQSINQSSINFTLFLCSSQMVHLPNGTFAKWFIRQMVHSPNGTQALHCTLEWLTPAISPMQRWETRSSNASFLLFKRICVRANRPFNLKHSDYRTVSPY